jgi:hypothetical protein
MSLLSLRLKRLRGSVRVSVLVSLLVGILVPAFLWAGAPAWWATRGVVTPGATADDYAAVNQGQVKHIAKQGYEEMKAKLPGGAGSSLDAVWATPAASTDDYRAINLGQLKAVAEPFYARLQALGYTGQPLAAGKNRPWTGTGADDFALANIGQVKNIFSFDLTGFAQTETYLLILGGDQQTGPSGQVLPQALSVRVVDAQGLPVANTTVSFSISGGAGTLSATTTSGTLTTVTVTTGITGQAVVYLKPQGSAGATTLTLASLTAQTAAQGLKFTAYVGGALVSTTGSATPPLAVTPDDMVDPGPGGNPTAAPYYAQTITPLADASQVATLTYLDVYWNRGEGSTAPKIYWAEVAGFDHYLIEKRVNLGEWLELGTTVATNSSDSGLLCGNLYEYRILGVTDAGRKNIISETRAYYVLMLKNATFSYMGRNGSISYEMEHGENPQVVGARVFNYDSTGPNGVFYPWHFNFYKVGFYPKAATLNSYSWIEVKVDASGNIDGFSEQVKSSSGNPSESQLGPPPKGTLLVDTSYDL